MSTTLIEYLKSPAKNTGFLQTPPKAPHNPFGRKINNAKAANVLLKKNADGTVTCAQYAPEDHPVYRHAIIHSPIAHKTLAETFSTPKGKHPAFNLNVNTPNGTAMEATHFIDVSLQSVKEKSDVIQSTLCLFSKKGDTPATIKPFAMDMDTTNEPHGNKENTPPIIKGGTAIDLELCHRDRRLEPQQKQVMGATAKAAFLKYIEENKHRYDDTTYSILKTLVEENSFEWLHCLAFRLCPEWFNPQAPENLGAALKDVNTYMMVLEGVAAEFAKEPSNKVTVLSRFKMLKNSSKLVEEIFYSVSIANQNKKVTLSSTIPALVLNNHTRPTTTDMPQAIHVAKALLKEKPPSRVRTLRF